MIDNAKIVSHAATGISAALIAKGVHKALPEKVKENPKTANAVSIGSGAGAAFVLRSAYLKKTEGIKLPAAMRKAGSFVIKKKLKL